MIMWDGKRLICREGVSVEELKRKYQRTPLAEPTISSSNIPQQSIDTKPRVVHRSDARPFKPLEEIIQLEKFMCEDPEKITEIWNHFYSQKDGFISGVMTSSFYADLQAASRKYPMVRPSSPQLHNY